MELLLFHHDEYRRLYNCSYKTDEEWWSYGRPHIPLGFAFVIIGFFMSIPYIPCLIVIVKTKLYRWAGYKIMIYVGAGDLLSLMVSGGISGMFVIYGVVACPYIDLHYVLGNLGVAIWAAQSLSVVLLAFNRCVEMWKPRYLYESFEGCRTYFWLLGCTIYSFLFVVWAPGLTFSTTGYAWFYDPYKNIPGLDFIDRTPYVNNYHYYHNMFIVVALPSLYAFLILSLWWKGRSAGKKLSKVQAIMTFQAFFLCLFTFLSAFIYDYMQFVPLPKAVSVGVNVTWQFSNGAPAILYLIVNKTIRAGVVALVMGQKIKKQMPTSSIAPTKSMIQPQSIQDDSMVL
ncbi:hypothetical protein L596_021026 [Steinernema carpocapsae]|uniref:G-protein coupled receptors family 1 profile domain-containing protein n=1 Tax=Steinernema carpocapsae TaxID=34508 RepID=A0A4U5MVB4_STECR|nr:hypothetical protein L596_021026 [Steinernema carpocapsae]